jgi:hypothetical protein
MNNYITSTKYVTPPSNIVFIKAVTICLLLDHMYASGTQRSQLTEGLLIVIKDWKIIVLRGKLISI